MSAEEMLEAADFTDHQLREAVQILSRLTREHLPYGYVIELRASRDGTMISLSRIDGDTLRVPDSTPKRGWSGAIGTACRDLIVRCWESS